jgi:CRISPR/Cas system-associated endonuclease Cas1
MGYEGQGAKAYFDGLSQLIDSDFANHPTLASDMMEEWRTVIVSPLLKLLLLSENVFGDYGIWRA